MRYQSSRKPCFSGRLSLPSLLFIFALAISLDGGPMLAGQTAAPVTSTSSTSTSSPIGSILPAVPVTTLKTPAQLEIEQEQLVLHQEQLVDNREDLQLTEAPLSHMNLSVLTVKAETVTHSKLSQAVDISGGFLSNISNRSANTVGSGFSRYSVPLGFHTSGARTMFSVSYVPEISAYTAVSGIYQSHAYQHSLIYSLSARTTLSWQVAVAHYRDVGQFLPVVLPVGGGGIAQPVGTSSNLAGLSTVNNAATVVTLQHRSSPRDQLTYTATAAWNELSQSNASTPAGAHQIVRNEPFAGDVNYEHALTPSTFIGAEATLAYVRGLSTSTSLLYETVQGTLRYVPRQNDSFTFAAGPLIRQTRGIAPGSQAGNMTYAVNAGYEHHTHIATMSADYARVVQLSLDNTALPAHQLAFTFGRPVNRNFDFTLVSRYIHVASATADFPQSSMSGAMRLDFRTGSRLGWFVNASGTYASQSQTGATAVNFNRNEISGGLRLTLDATRVR